jgi:serine/threonine-protein kinase
MPQSTLNNFIEGKHRELNKHFEDDLEYKNLYRGIENQTLQVILSTAQKHLVDLFEKMNLRLPTDDNGAHYWAEESRQLRYLVNMLTGLAKGLIDTPCAIRINGNYQKVFNWLGGFLEDSGGSEIPPHSESIDILYTDPIAMPADKLFVKEIPADLWQLSLTMRGEGGYATVFSFTDPVTGKPVALKRAKTDLDEKELKRFKQEYETLRSLDSPYVLEAYKFFESPYQYTMEYAEQTLKQYLRYNNQTISVANRVGIARQILRGFSYIHSKGLLHRDVSPNNVLIQHHEDTLVVKISDFGLVKRPDSTLTSRDSVVNGTWLDPLLDSKTFGEYDMTNEVYALTRLIFFVMTGKEKPTRIDDPALAEFTRRGMDVEHPERRYKDDGEIRDAFERMVGKATQFQR